MRKLIEQSAELYSMLEYFTTKNQDDTTSLPTIPSKPFDEHGQVEKQVIKIMNEKYFGETNIKCVLINKK